MASILFGGVTESTPRWLADDISENVLPIPAKLDPAAFVDALADRIVVGVAGAAADATTVPVLALPRALKKGDTLNFGTNKFLTVNADAAAGAVSLTTLAIPKALVSLDTAYYSDYPNRKAIPSGTLIGRTFTERDANTAYGPAVDTDDEIFLIPFDIANAYDNADVELVRHGAVVRENYLPDWTAISANANLLAKLRLLYQTIKGVD